MAAVHTNARGTEPYDKVYCLGYQVHHEDWSPLSPRATGSTNTCPKSRRWPTPLKMCCCTAA